jgi:hypothetical protein
MRTRFGLLVNAALLLVACGNQLEWRIERAVVSGALPADATEPVQRWAITVGPCTPTPTPESIVHAGSALEPRDRDLAAGTYCFWSLQARRFTREATRERDDLADPCRLEAIGTAERTLPAEQGLVVTAEELVTDAARPTWDAALAVLDSTCAPRRDPARCTCPFSTAAAEDATAPNPACVAPIDAELVAIAEHWACAAAAGQSELWCWGDETVRGGEVRAPHHAFAGNDAGNTFPLAQIEAHGSTICARTSLGRIRCGSDPTALFRGDLQHVLDGPDYPTGFNAREMAIGTAVGDITTTCALGTAGDAVTIECDPQDASTARWTLEANAAQMSELAIGDGELCTIEGNFARCTRLVPGLPAAWGEQLDVVGSAAPDAVVDLWMRPTAVCVQLTSGELRCATTTLGPFFRQGEGSDASLADEGLSVRTSSGLEWHPFMGDDRVTPLLRGTIQHGLACGNESAMSALGLRSLACQAVDAGSPLLAPALSLTTRDETVAEGAELAVCPFR